MLNVFSRETLPISYGYISKIIRNYEYECLCKVFIQVKESNKELRRKMDIYMERNEKQIKEQEI